MSLSEAISLFIAGYFSTCKRSDKTIAAYTSDLRQFASSAAHRTSISEITPETIEHWATTLKSDGYATASIRRKLASLAVFFRYWERRQLIPQSPLRLVHIDLGTSRILCRVLTQRELDSILEKARQEALDSRTRLEILLTSRNYALVELMLATGLRVGEVASISLGDMQLEEHSILVRGKGDRQRMAYLIDNYSREALAKYMKVRQLNTVCSKALFLNTAGRPITAQGIAYVVASLAKRAEVERHVTPHMFRHTAATLLLRNGADIRVVQEFLGHASISTTQRYTHVSKDLLVAKLRLTHPNLGRVDPTRPA